MKHSAKVMSLVMALSVTTAMVSQASGQTQPDQAQQQKQDQQQKQAQQQQNTQNNRTARVRLIGLRVRQPEPQSEPLRETLPRARSSELGIPVASRGGRTDSTNNTI